MKIDPVSCMDVDPRSTCRLSRMGSATSSARQDAWMTPWPIPRSMWRDSDRIRGEMYRGMLARRLHGGPGLGTFPSP